MIKITLPDGEIREYSGHVTPLDVAKSIGEAFARNVISAQVDNKQVETDTPITSDARLRLFTWKDDMGKKAFWHSSAHLLAQAIMEFYPDVKLTLGPPIDNGFYYDVDFGDHHISEKDFGKIEQRMIENARKKFSFKKYSVAKKQALNTYAGNEFKTELISNLKDGEITFVTHDNFTDLCRGGHIPNTGIIKAVKLLNIAGAYWRGDENNKQLTRIYGISFPKQKDLKEYLHLLEEAKKRDHRKLGKSLGLFTFSQKVGSGLPLWLPKGTIIRKRLEDFLSKAQLTAGYEFVTTPHIGSKDLYVTSGHYAKFGEDIFQPIKTPNEGEEYLLKPMNCPHHCEIYNAHKWSYRDLPKRYAEFGTVYRYEQSGELHGLTRVRGFTQDDAHIFCTAGQLLTEFKKVIDLVLYVFKALSFDDFKAQISLRSLDNPDKYIGTKENWEKAEKAIIQAAEEKKLPVTIQYGEAAFYGPKLDFMVKDALKREWQLGTIQVDYNLPERFGLNYKDANNQDQRPIMIHRAPFGSLERFIAILLEHTAGDLPLWLSPEQYKILPISEKHHEYAEKVLNLLSEKNLCGTIDSRSETTGRKIRDCEAAKIPYMIIIGERESENSTISVRRHKQGDLGTMSIENFIKKMKKELSYNH